MGDVNQKTRNFGLTAAPLCATIRAQFASKGAMSTILYLAPTATGKTTCVLKNAIRQAAAKAGNGAKVQLEWPNLERIS